MFVEHKESGEVPQAPAKVLKLSEAIRKGARIRPQCKGNFFLGGSSCAMGAAYEAATDRTEVDAGTMFRVLPFLMDGPTRLSDLATEIGKRNDSGDTREQIADWLEAQGY